MGDSSYDLGGFVPRCNFNMSAVAATEVDRIRDDLDYVNESMSDVLKSATLAALLAVPGLVDGAEVSKRLESSGNGGIVQVNSPKVQKKIYDAIGKDRYEDAVIVNLIARTLMGEAVGERSTAAFDAVATVIWNRSGGDKRRIADVILKPLQFSCWNKMTDADKRNFVIKPHGRALTSPSAWKYCTYLAKSMVDGNFTPVGDWTHYYAHKKVKPKWASKMTNVKKVGNQTFGRIADEGGRRV